MSAVDELFADLRNRNEKAFMPFLTAGDPNLETSAALLKTLDQAGCHLCELGIPFSDPIADGPTIQASYTRALDHGIKLEKILETAKQTTPELKMPLVTMVSYSIVYRKGISNYLDAAKDAGVSGLIVPDLPIEEANEITTRCAERDLSLIQLITPATPRDRAKRIADSSTGFIYYVSVTGITGERTELPDDITDNLKWLRDQTELPICVGFGIAGPEQARMLAPHCDGLIVGSAIVRRIEKAIGEGSSPNAAVHQFCEQILQSIR